jgi:hypothetical protein
MSETRWAVDGPDGEVLELNGRKFSSNDDGAPMLVRHILAGYSGSSDIRQCSMVCRSMGRHAHVAFCRSNDPTTCAGPDVHHSQTRMFPASERPKDWISHKLHWQRTGGIRPRTPSILADATSYQGFKGQRQGQHSYMTR